ncbi:MAG: SUMF1/EgtB/PvdO family nonheme iron enzyme [Gemmataceae bacterium]
MLAELDELATADVSAPPLPPMPPIRRKRRPWHEYVHSSGVALVLLAAVCATGYVVFARKHEVKDGKAKESRPISLPRMVNSVGMTLVQVPGGELVMGDPLRADAPLHRVLLARSFWVGIHEVTQKQYQLVTGLNPSRFQGDSYPVERVSWTDAVEFCQKLSERDEEVQAGRTYRLPTEAEWEYFCRANGRTAFTNGPSISAQAANLLLGGLSRTAAVGTYAPNAWGLYDVHGNVWEWCSDWYGLDAYKVGSGIDPTGPDTGRTRVARGGSFQSIPEECRAGYRNDSFAPDHKAPDLGFRVICTTIK